MISTCSATTSRWSAESARSSVPSLMTVESYHQRPPAGLDGSRPTSQTEVSTVAALRALFPAGSMTGRPQAADDAGDRRGRDHSARSLRRRVRLDLRRRPRRSRRGDPLSVRRLPADAAGSGPAEGSPSGPTCRRSGRRRSGRPSVCCWPCHGDHVPVGERSLLAGEHDRGVGDVAEAGAATERHAPCSLLAIRTSSPMSTQVDAGHADVEVGSLPHPWLGGEPACRPRSRCRARRSSVVRRQGAADPRHVTVQGPWPSR